MLKVIQVDDCQRDSPRFRTYIDRQESKLEQLEQKLDRILLVCGAMIDSGKQYTSNQCLFANSLWELSVFFNDDPTVLSSLNKLIHSFQEINKFQTTLLDQASRTVLKNLTSFIKKDIKDCKENRQQFEKISNEFDSILVKNSQASKNKPLEVDEVQNLLIATQTCFGHQALNYVSAIEMIASKKRFEILSTLLSYMCAISTYYHQGWDLCCDLEPFFKTLGNDMEIMRNDTDLLRKQLADVHNIANDNRSLVYRQMCPNAPTMDGYLFKRTTNAFKSWHRRWFCLQNNKLMYRKRSGCDTFTVIEEDLRLCTVKPVISNERRFCFEVLSPAKSHMLQTDSQEMYDAWIFALQKGIGAAIEQIPYTSDDRFSKSVNATRSEHVAPLPVRVSEQLLEIPGNELCCDCRCPMPSWASINLGITLCIECSGVHRSLGVHYSKVRSLTLDEWEPEVVKVMAELGNSVVNHIYEANVPSAFQRACHGCTGIVREHWIKSKYVERKFVKSLEENCANSIWHVRKLRRRNGLKHQEDKRNVEYVGDEFSTLFLTKLSLDAIQDNSTGSEDEEDDTSDQLTSSFSTNLLLYQAAAAHNLPLMCHALALGADKHWTNAHDHQQTSLHKAILSGSVMAVAYLLLNGVKINAQNDDGCTPLHLATQFGKTAQVCLLLKYNADQNISDKNGKLALGIAEDTENANIVTLLRLARLNEEMKMSESDGYGDETFNEVVKDFSLLPTSLSDRSKKNEIDESSA